MEKQTKFPYQFFLVTFLWAWICWLPLVLAGIGILPIDIKQTAGLLITYSLTLLGVFGPMIGAFYCLRKYNGKGSIKNYLHSLLDLKLGWAAYIVPVLVLTCCTFLAWIIPEIWGEKHIPVTLRSVYLLPLTFLLMTLLGGGQEELGWRGYILDHLEEKFGPWLGNLILGIVWACWHIPLFFIPGTSQSSTPFIAFLIMFIGLSGILSWARWASGKRTSSGLIIHGVFNTIPTIFPVLVMVRGDFQSRFWIGACILLISGVVMMVFRTRKAK